MNNEEKAYIIWSHIPGIGSAMFQRLLSRFGSAEGAWRASKNELSRVLSEPVLHMVFEWQEKNDIDYLLSGYEKKGITVLSRLHPFYPVQFHRLPNPPVCVYCKGTVSKDTFYEQRSISIVGTRKSTPYGEQLARKFGRELAEEGYCVISGLAMGIDSMAHWGCLEGNGTAIAVLGNGVDIVYPARNIALYKSILDSGGVLMSEYPPGEHAAKGMFVMRNRLIAALSIGTIVVEGELQSGSMITAKAALELHKDVFAPPVPVTSSGSEGPNYLLQQGAFLVTKAEDILSFYGHTVTATAKSQQFSKEEQRIMDVVQYDGATPDIMREKTGLSVQNILGLITALQLKKALILQPDGKYYRQL